MAIITSETIKPEHYDDKHRWCPLDSAIISKCLPLLSSIFPKWLLWCVLVLTSKWWDHDSLWVFNRIVEIKSEILHNHFTPSLDMDVSVSACVQATYHRTLLSDWLQSNGISWNKIKKIQIHWDRWHWFFFVQINSFVLTDLMMMKK